MKFLVSIVLIAVISFLTCIYLPWWSIAWVAMLVIVIIPQKPMNAFLAGFIALFILWSFMALYINARNDSILSHKMSMIILKMDSPALIIVFTGLIGALVAGLAALAGSFLRRETR